jgi:hypothetical protein
VADVPSGPSLDSTPHYSNLKENYLLTLPRAFDSGSTTERSVVEPLPKRGS